MPFASVDLLSDDERVDKGSEPVPVRPRAKSVVKLLSRAPDTPEGKSLLLGHHVCQRAFRQLLGLGASRYTRLKRAARLHEPAPLDGRSLPRRYSFVSQKDSLDKRSKVVEFLEELWNTVAETMPEATQLLPTKRKAAGESQLKPLRFRRRGKRLKAAAAEHRGQSVHDLSCRMLPPGSFKDYHRLFLAKHPDMTVWSQSTYGATLKVRASTQHAQCSVCHKHKAIIKKLGGDAAARQEQLVQFQAHLRRQYSDRCQYWSKRSASRLPVTPTGRQTICIITDAIDKSKFRYPRTRLMTSKDFHSFQRPQMDMTTCIAHGFHVFLALSEPFQKKDSSWCAELVSHSLHCIGHCTDLRSADIYLQADNTCREVKNNTLTRLCGLLSGLHRVHSITLNFLTTGHSHEDVDQFFSAVTNYLQKDENQELHTPDAFIASLQRWLDDPQIRPYERHRFVRKVDAVRAEPYCMVDAADHLEKLARQELGRGPLLDVSRSASALYDHA
ncbi:Modification methylase ScrFIA [Durusdinium trenchii]|uniref:Modification methylase ScrFIA n=1 Tax=Durusdinium trenchii TaxID=1381693 RepID=A0ABP0RTP6_9DINO